MRQGVATALRRELRGLTPELARSPLARSALVLARRLDDLEIGDAALATVARELRITLDRIAALAAEGAVATRLDELADRRAARRAS